MKNAETGICRTCTSGKMACCLRSECDTEGVPILSCAHHKRTEIIEAHAENNQVIAGRS